MAFQNAAIIDAAIAEVGVDKALAYAVIEMESSGRHVYGNDSGGVFSTPGTPDIAVTKENYAEYYRRVLAGETANGVGIMQITYAGPRRTDGTRDGGFHRIAREQGLDLSDPHDNVVFGLRLVRDYLKAAGGVPTEGAVKAVGTRYNGSTAYGDRLWTTYLAWVDKLQPVPVPVPTPEPEPPVVVEPTPEPEPPTVEPEPVLEPLTVELSPDSRAVLTGLAASLDGLTAALNRFNR